MAGKLKLWRTRFDFPGALNHQHESQTATDRWIREQVRKRKR